MRFTTVIFRVAMFCMTAGVCVWLTRRFGAWAAIGIWTLGIGAACGGVALLMSRQPPERIGPVNYLAGIVLSWGYAIGRGKLLPIVIESWVRWVLLGAAVVVATTHGTWYGRASDAQASTEGYHRSASVTAMLLISWLILGAVVLRLITVLATRASGNPIPPGTFTPLLVMVALVLASVALTIFGHSAATTTIALALTGGPIVVVGGGYGLFVLVMLTAGRKTSWH